jgi:hypothetical protein
VFVLPMDTPGVEVRPIGTLGGERTNFVYLENVRVDDRWRIGGVNEGWTVVSAPLSQEHGMGRDDEHAANVGFLYIDECQKILDAVVEWASETTDDETGACRIDDPVLREAIAELVVDMELARSAPGPMGRIAASDVLMRGASMLLDVVGTAGLVARDSEGAVCEGLTESGFRFAPGTAIYGRSTDIARNVIAERFLGLPRSTTEEQAMTETTDLPETPGDATTRTSPTRLPPRTSEETLRRRWPWRNRKRSMPVSRHARSCHWRESTSWGPPSASTCSPVAITSGDPGHGQHSERIAR